MYTVALKAKEAEFVAVANLSKFARDELRLLFDIQKPGRNRNALLHLQSVAGDIAECWGPDRSIYIDLLDFGSDVKVESGEHAVTFLFRQFQGGMIFPVRAIPVTGLQIERGAAYIEAVRDVVAADKRGICLRLHREDFLDPEETSRGLLELLAILNTVPENVDLLLDFRSVLDDSVGELARRGVRLLKVLSKRYRFRSYAVMSSNIPDSVADVVEDWDSEAKVPRVEWRLWDLIRGVFPELQIGFGDYGTVAPDFAGGGGGNENINAKIRYPTALNYIFLRGRPLLKPEKNYEQFHDLSAKLVRMEEFSGPDASWGDRGILACAQRRASPGSLTTWVQQTCNHHIELTVREERVRAGIPVSA